MEVIVNNTVYYLLCFMYLCFLLMYVVDDFEPSGGDASDDEETIAKEEMQAIYLKVCMRSRVWVQSVMF